MYSFTTHGRRFVGGTGIARTEDSEVREAREERGVRGAGQEHPSPAGRAGERCRERPEGEVRFLEDPYLSAYTLDGMVPPYSRPKLPVDSPMFGLPLAARFRRAAEKSRMKLFAMRSIWLTFIIRKRSVPLVPTYAASTIRFWSSRPSLRTVTVTVLARP